MHVQVHNHSASPSGSVQVWAIYARLAAGMPSLAASPSLNNAFPFWSQFQAAGIIAPNLPADSPWKSIGAPVTLTGIDAAHPRLASWSWTIPTLSSGDLGHYCLVAFIHAANATVGETVRMNVDAITPTNRQVGQKNLHIGPPLPASPGPAPGPPTGGGPRPGPTWYPYVELHSPGPMHVRSQIHLDLRALPAALRVSFMLTPLPTERPLDRSTRGLLRTREASSADFPPSLRGRRRPGAVSLVAKLVAWLLRLLGIGRVKPPGGSGPPDLLDRLRPVVYEAAPSEVVEIDGVRLAPFGTAGMLVRVENGGSLEPGSRHRFEVQQHMSLLEREGPLIGGATLEVVIAGTPATTTPPRPPTHDLTADRDERERAEREGERTRWVPPWMREQVERGQRERKGRLGPEDPLGA